MDPQLLALAAKAHRRRRRTLVWSAVSVLGAAAVMLIAWEGLVGPVSSLRPAGYLSLVVFLAAAGLAAARSWNRPPAHSDIARGIDLFFPQTRGGIAELEHPAVGSLGRARQGAAREWLQRHGDTRLDEALGEGERRRARDRRRISAGLGVLAALAALASPGAALRLAAALRSPSSVWEEPATRWAIDPGDAVVERGTRVDGRGRFSGPPVDALLILERRAPDGMWSAETLGGDPTGRWQWDAVSADTEYRLRYGPFTSPVHRVTVRPPLAVVRLEARSPGGAWASLAGRTLSGGPRFEMRGASSRGLTDARLEFENGSSVRFATQDRSFSGSIVPPAGEARVVVRDSSGSVAASEPFQVAGRGALWIEVLLPAEDPVVLTTIRVWIEARAVSALGVRNVRWETVDGRTGSLGAPAGARDTTLATAAPLAQDVAPGETLLYRIVAVDAAGRQASTRWRTAIVDDRPRLAREARQERETAAQYMAEAIAEARAERAEGGERDAPAGGLDAHLRRAADSLATALDRALGDPALSPELAERLEALRQFLQGAARARLAPPPGAPPDPAIASAARASVLEAIRQRLGEVDSLVALEAGIDSLMRISDAERSLADRTLGTAPGALAREIAPRQDAIARSARDASGALPDSLEWAVGQALDRAGTEVRSGDPARAARAQAGAAATLSMAAREARASLGADAEEIRRHRAVLDRAGGQVLFLAKREEELLARMTRPAATAAEHADRAARQRVVTGGLERTLRALVEAIGGRPAAADLAETLAEAVYLTRIAEERIAEAPGALIPTDAPAAAEAAAGALARLARSLLLPADDSSAVRGAGQESVGAFSATTAARLQAMAEAERALAEALMSAPQGTGGNPDAAAGQREIGRGLEELADPLLEAGVDPATLLSLRESVAGAAGQLERGLPGARMESELRALSRRFADLGRMVERSATDRRRSRTAGAFLPADPPPLPERATAPRLDPEAALAPWRDALPAGALDVGRAYLERLAEEGVRRPAESR